MTAAPPADLAVLDDWMDERAKAAESRGFWGLAATVLSAFGLGWLIGGSGDDGDE